MVPHRELAQSPTCTGTNMPKMINPTIADAHRLVGSIQPTTAPAAIEAESRLR